jgi:septum formation protein
MTRRLILASGSAIRAKILKDAGVAFEARKPDVDEAALKRALSGRDLEAIAQALADAKALAVAAPGAFIIGSDQILEHRGKAYDKPATLAEAADRLFALSGETHTLINAVSVAKDGAIVFRALQRPRLIMRTLSRAEILRYLERAGPDILSSVGAYQVESLGAQLFERIEGDYFSVLGLSLFPLLAFLRAQGFEFFA